MGLHKAGVILTIAFLTAAGCNRSPTPDESIDKGLKEAGLTKVTAYPLAGKVTIDQQPLQLAQGQRLVLMLNDPQKPDELWTQKPFVEANSEGDFTFGTYRKGDGIKAGKYVVTFAVLKRKGKKGLAGPDQLKNLYNDPDKNQQNFNIDHQAPGKTDYAFNLDMAGKEAAQPGPHALTNMLDSDMRP
jgi:hypothetical protein